MWLVCLKLRTKNLCVLYGAQMLSHMPLTEGGPSPLPASPPVTFSVKTVSSAQVCSRAVSASLEKDRVSVGPVLPSPGSSVCESGFVYELWRAAGVQPQVALYPAHGFLRFFRETRLFSYTK